MKKQCGYLNISSKFYYYNEENCTLYEGILRNTSFICISSLHACRWYSTRWYTNSHYTYLPHCNGGSVLFPGHMWSHTLCSLFDTQLHIPEEEVKKLYYGCFYILYVSLSNRVIRLTTPLLNYVVISGALLMYMSVFFGLIPTTKENIFKMQCLVSC